MMLRTEIIEWDLSLFIVGGTIATVAWTLWGIRQALRPVRKPTLNGYDVVKVASQVAREHWKDEVA